MSLLTSLSWDGLSALWKLVPSYYVIGAAAIVLAGLLIWAKVWFHNKVEAEAQKEINAYIATQKKDEAELQEISTGVNTKIQIQYVDRTKVIVKTVHDNTNVIKDVPDTATILSDGWVSSFNSIVQGKPIDPAAASVKTLSGISAVDALNVDNLNYGTCLQYKEVAEGWQNWYVQQKQVIADQNKKDK